ncbi:hypothetical protein [Chitinophaga sp. S165]|uniref:hypothetical protein n=1 Tax=Chitinophaga sp. S165 TaxID=2135462 RepID=UPI000D709413|nr:hypothetical protein [Chitinophaga sp. S165]PWV50444.1 hypothetical protein C7475_10464 [Chitinophaga sp. S165]
MKPYILLITLLFSGLGISIAQQRTRDKLFPSFQKDYSALKEKEKDSKPAPQAKNARSAREQMFTNYQPQTAPAPNRSSALKRSVAPGGKNPSDISATEALNAERSRRTDLPATPVPTQGFETERSSTPFKNASPAITTPPAKAAAPTAVPFRKTFERKKQ